MFLLLRADNVWSGLMCFMFPSHFATTGAMLAPPNSCGLHVADSIDFWPSFKRPIAMGCQKGLSFVSLLFSKSSHASHVISYFFFVHLHFTFFLRHPKPHLVPVFHVEKRRRCWEMFHDALCRRAIGELGDGASHTAAFCQIVSKSSKHVI